MIERLPIKAGTLRRVGPDETLPTGLHAGAPGRMAPDNRRMPARETVSDDVVHRLTAADMALFHPQNPQRGAHAVRFTRARQRA